MVLSENDRALARLPCLKRVFFKFLRLFFKLLYHQLAWTYDGVAWVVSLGNWQKWVEATIAYLDGPRILEIGFGPGHLQLALQREDVLVLGLDESQQMVNLARRRLKKHGFLPHLVRGDAQTIPLASECVNQVVLTFPAEFIFKSSTISEIRRVLVPGGKVLVVAIAWITGRKPLERLLAWVNRIAGQAPNWEPRMLEPLKASGFAVSWEMVELSNSKLVLISLTKA